MARTSRYVSDHSGQPIPSIKNRVRISVSIVGDDWNKAATFDVLADEVDEAIVQHLPEGVSLRERKPRGKAAQEAAKRASGEIL